MAAGQGGPGCQAEQEMARGQGKQPGAGTEVSVCPRIAQRGPAFQGFGQGHLVSVHPGIPSSTTGASHLHVCFKRDPHKYT